MKLKRMKRKKTTSYFLSFFINYVLQTISKTFGNNFSKNSKFFLEVLGKLYKFLQNMFG